MDHVADPPGVNWKIHVHCRIWNESIGYIVFIDRTKPDNSVRINPATRHSETKYGFVTLTGDMDTGTVPTFLACGAFFALSFVTIWAFWFVERLRGANAPHV